MFVLAQSSKAPVGTTTASYTVFRLGSSFRVHLGFAETVPLKEGPLRVLTSAEDTIRLEHYQEAGWGANQEARIEGLNDLVGASVEDAFRNVLGVVISVDGATGSVRLDRALTRSLSGVHVWFSVLSSVKTTPQVQGQNGKAWTLELDTANEQDIEVLQELLARSYVDAVMAVLAKCAESGVEGMPTMPEVFGAVVALGGEGVNMDGHLAKHAETVELRRREGTLSVPVIAGEAP